MTYRNRIIGFTIFLILLLNMANLVIAGEGKTFYNFKLKDYQGKEHALSDFKDSKAIVVMFIATRCPVSNAYNERMEKIYDEYKTKNIAFVGINSNKKEDEKEIAEHAKENGLNFTILKDWNNVIADKFEAQFTPEIYVLSSDKYELLYHGRIDDSRRESDVEKKDLQQALDEILNGKEVSVTETKAFGCTIKRI